MFDTRIGESSIMTVEHGAPVESVLMFPAGGVFISAGRPVSFLLKHAHSVA